MLVHRLFGAEPVLYTASSLQACSTVTCHDVMRHAAPMHVHQQCHPSLCSALVAQATRLLLPTPDGHALDVCCRYGDNFSTKRGGVPDLSHWDGARQQMKQHISSNMQEAQGSDAAPRG